MGNHKCIFLSYRSLNEEWSYRSLTKHHSYCLQVAQLPYSSVWSYPLLHNVYSKHHSTKYKDLSSVTLFPQHSRWYITWIATKVMWWHTFLQKKNRLKNWGNNHTFSMASILEGVTAQLPSPFGQCDVDMCSWMWIIG